MRRPVRCALPPTGTRNRGIGQLAPLRELPPASELRALPHRWDAVPYIVDWLGIHGRRYRKAHDGSWRFATDVTQCYRYYSSVRYRRQMAEIPYLPRIWWDDEALASGEAYDPKTEPKLRGRRRKGPSNAYEMTSNRLYTWMRQHGEQYGWKFMPDAWSAQNIANHGALVLLLAARNRPNGTRGRVVIVSPEGRLKPRAHRNGVKVIDPVQIEAGKDACRAFTDERNGERVSRWWEDAHEWTDHVFAAASSSR